MLFGLTKRFSLGANAVSSALDFTWEVCYIIAEAEKLRVLSSDPSVDKT